MLEDFFKNFNDSIGDYLAGVETRANEINEGENSEFVSSETVMQTSQVFQTTEEASMYKHDGTGEGLKRLINKKKTTDYIMGEFDVS